MQLQYLSAAADSQEIQNQLERHGALVIENVIDQTNIEALNKELEPFILKTPTGYDDMVAELPKQITSTSLHTL